MQGGLRLCCSLTPEDGFSRDEARITLYPADSDAITISTVKPVLSGHSKRRPNIVFQDRLSLNAGQKYYRMLQWEHSAILSTFIKLPSVIKIFALFIFDWLLKAGYTVFTYNINKANTHF